MKQDDPFASTRLEGFVVVELRVGLLVEAVEVSLAEPDGCHVLAEIEEVFDEHAERATPVADVVLADHRVTEERPRAARASHR